MKIKKQYEDLFISLYLSSLTIKSLKYQKKSLFEERFQKVLQIKILFHPFGRDLPKRYFPKYFCILIISFKKIAEIEDPNNDDVESDKFFQKILSIQRLKNNI